MKHIEKISINNARRLGENIQIEFGKGATIILAPNGTGKTTIFEAIELALTGQIKRIEDSPDAIIRNGISKMNVRLDFSQGKFCQVDYSRGGICNQIGDYNELFKIENKSSVPYLFRLTHFLEQRGKRWLVEQDDKVAGDLLSQLPIGKDLQQIISKKTSLLRAIGIAQTTAENELDEAKRKLYEFEELRNRRDELVVVATLTPLEEIVGKLQSISSVIEYEEFNDEHNATIINTYFEKIKVLIKQQYNTKEELVIKLNTLKERVQLFVSNLELLSRKETILLEYSIQIDNLRSSLEQGKKEVQDEKKCLSDIRVKIKELNLVQSMFKEVEQKQKYSTIKKSELELNKKTISELQKTYDLINEELKKNERFRDKYKLLDEAISGEKENLTQIEIKREYQKKWHDLSRINNEIIEVKIPAIENKKRECMESKSHIDNEVSEAEQLYSIRKNTLKTLNKASSDIQDAISTIRKHLSGNERNCPVCQAEYEPDELISKIEESLKTLNPAIPQTIKDEKNALDALKIAKEKQKTENQKLQDIIFELNMENNKLEENQKKILEDLQPQFSGCKTPEEANNYIEELVEKSTCKISALEAERSQFESELIIAEISNAKLKKSEDERCINELITKNENLENEIMNEITYINSINESLVGNDKETVSQSICLKLNEESKKIEYIQKLEALVAKNDDELKECEGLFLSENEAISKIKSIQDGIYTEWSRVGLEAEPNLEKLKIEFEEVSNSINELEKAIEISNKIEQELTSWSANEKFNEVDNKIKKQIGDTNEEEYLESLISLVSKNDSILANIKEKRNAVNLFLTNATLESEKIHEQLNTINEPWKRLLKRIVINPLISAAPLLSNTTSRNKPIAKTSAIIHDQNIDITNIASEAQITDLQLTLMLSMANKYEWTPWKALLLDDPTQHHDLVHASSVFDVLRDYIIDLDYQVMMTTHDSIQASFFQRKLENEGIPSKIYRLVARKNGVTAELMN
ncbi:AAA family ATPase [Clostridium sporogenes]|uniref:AAA family ATPase n=1 Tax=Clostridium sporogenes TaxID=1509 RepID=UPI00214A6241|nr:AAA family ATPase [Clostridium sporogenes]MCR1973816.1 AAA family ATPase [Clostridium sporogenes]